MALFVSRLSPRSVPLLANNTVVSHAYNTVVSHAYTFHDTVMLHTAYQGAEEGGLALTIGASVSLAPCFLFDFEVPTLFFRV